MTAYRNMMSKGVFNKQELYFPQLYFPKIHHERCKKYSHSRRIGTFNHYFITKCSKFGTPHHPCSHMFNFDSPHTLLEPSKLDLNPPMNMRCKLRILLKRNTILELVRTLSHGSWYFQKALTSPFVDLFILFCSFINSRKNTLKSFNFIIMKTEFRVGI